MTEHSLLVVLAHPDDESFPIGGTLAKYADEGAHITLISATRGEAGIPWASPVGHRRDPRARAARARPQRLGVADVRFLDQLDGMLYQADHARIIDRLVAAMRELHPQVVITFGSDGISGHSDHLVMHGLATAAFDRADLDDAQLFYISPSEATRQGCGVDLIQRSGRWPGRRDRCRRLSGDEGSRDAVSRQPARRTLAHLSRRRPAWSAMSTSRSPGRYDGPAGHRRSVRATAGADQLIRKVNAMLYLILTLLLFALSFLRIDIGRLVALA